jgi:hypothetical protein
MPEGVAGADFAITTVYQEFALLSARYITSPFGRLGLGIVDRGRTLAALAFHGPFALVGHYVLIFSRHRFTLIAHALCAKTEWVRDLIPSAVRPPPRHVGLVGRCVADTVFDSLKKLHRPHRFHPHFMTGRYFCRHVKGIAGQDGGIHAETGGAIS